MDYQLSKLFQTRPHKDQMLQKLEDLSVTKYHQLRNSKKTTIIKAIRNRESNSLPAQQQQHHGVEQQQQLHTTEHQRNDGLTEDDMAWKMDLEPFWRAILKVLCVRSFQKSFRR